MALPNIDDVPQMQLAEDGEHELEITNAAEFYGQKSGRLCWRVRFRTLDQEDAEDFSEVLAFPEDTDEPRTARLLGSKIRAFMESFGLNGGMEAADTIGATGRGIVARQEAYNGDGEENCIKKFL